MTKYWTDHYVVILGDPPNQPAPMRECDILGYKGDDHCRVRIQGVIKLIKRDRIYTAPSTESPLATAGPG